VIQLQQQQQQQAQQDKEMVPVEADQAQQVQPAQEQEEEDGTRPEPLPSNSTFSTRWQHTVACVRDWINVPEPKDDQVDDEDDVRFDSQIRDEKEHVRLPLHSGITKNMDKGEKFVKKPNSKIADRNNQRKGLEEGEFISTDDHFKSKVDHQVTPEDFSSIFLRPKVDSDMAVHMPGLTKSGLSRGFTFKGDYWEAEAADAKRVLAIQSANKWILDTYIAMSEALMNGANPYEVGVEMDNLTKTQKELNVVLDEKVTFWFMNGILRKRDAALKGATIPNMTEEMKVTLRASPFQSNKIFKFKDEDIKKEEERTERNWIKDFMGTVGKSLATNLNQKKNFNNQNQQQKKQNNSGANQNASRPKWNNSTTTSNNNNNSNSNTQGGSSNTQSSRGRGAGARGGTRGRGARGGYRGGARGGSRGGKASNYSSKGKFGKQWSA
jgi:hypothetical protein